ncbi:MAG: neutral zinc metallopeptidase [Muribaculaceae bacterium]|nr:neutral zinc metallopeptidase [Muribaculaceae bacterium]
MRLNGRRMSRNVVDRRGSGGGGSGFGGFNFGGGRGMKLTGAGSIIGFLIVGAILLLGGGDATQILNGGMQNFQIQTSDPNYTPTAHEEELAEFASQILAGTEDVWSEKFREMGRTYVPPKMVLFTGSVQSACGGATASVGPFYCSADQTIYIDLSFFDQMEHEMHAGGDFAYAYVIAHEVGHHVQYLLGTLDQAHSAMARTSETEANRISVRTELQADYYAGVWAHGDNEMFNSLEPGDIEEGLNAASKIGDDYLQKQAYGYTQPETFNHGRSDQRVRWLKKGAESGSLSGGDTFSPSYSSL